MKLVWLTDIHLDHLGPRRTLEFFDSLRDIACDEFLLTGDISVSSEIVDDLSKFAESTGKNVNFVLGNHDFWYSSTDVVRSAVRALEARDPRIVHLNNRPFVSLSSRTALVGHDCWYDAVYGDWKKSNFRMCDWVFIHDYVDIGAARHGGHGRVLDPDMPVIVGRSRALALQGVSHIELGIDAAIAAGHRRLIVASHVPPFDDAHIFQGKKGDAAAQPWFTSGLLGEMLLRKSVENPAVAFTSLSGHTHGSYIGQRSQNLHVRVGGADYGYPELQEIIDA